ncbi:MULTISPECIES: hypothetical protein [Rhodococcus]|uniref:Uncharacterized protein n=1 Tax=Rhodococcus qingshengii TaxID=334542 RepID=A0A2A5JIE4_RHOSG|nr:MULTISPECIES: hypothetical protein [Rhodococcus]EME14863.1 hypothetical protein G418_29477 [Rhodococcus qingshengii BKS 20-40]MBP2526111.1 hypothetical protein [Rhodococcus sp. PvP104]MDA3636786.1 hypothetical protein [Rhodococcus sp. C-2]PCK29273.1 hypothetical protein CHR55_02510 [Rhodococcus qingshengii]
MNGPATPTRLSRTTATLGVGALAAAITFGSAVGTASADSPVVDLGSISFAVTNGPDNTIYDINAIINLPPGTLPPGMMTPQITAPAAPPQPVGDPFAGTALDFVLSFIQALAR